MRCLDHRLKKLHRNLSRPRDFRWRGFCNRKDARSRPFFRGLKRSVERQTYSPLENFQVARKETREGGGMNARGWVGWPLWCNRTEIVLLSVYEAGPRAIIRRGSMQTWTDSDSDGNGFKILVTCNTLNPGWITSYVTSYAARGILRDIGRIC